MSSVADAGTIPISDRPRNWTTPARASGRSGWLNYIFSFPVMLGVVLACINYYFATSSMDDPDIWWHLRNAESFVQTGHIVSRDAYSFTATGTPWMNHEWLSELPYYVGWHWLGFRGLYLVQLFGVEAILLGTFYRSYSASRNIKAAFLVSWFAVLLATVSFGPRTLLFGWIFLIVELVILDRFREGKDLTGWLPVVFLLWVNTHGSWLIGLVLFFVFIVSGLFDGRWGRIEAISWTRPQLCRLGATFLLSLMALFINPYGYRLVFYPFNLAFRQPLNVHYIEEWQSLDFHTGRGKIMLLLLAATILLALLKKHGWRLDEVAFLLIGIYSALNYTRFLFLAAIIVTPILASKLDFLSSYSPQRDRPWLNGAVIATLLVACLSRFPSQALLMKGTVSSYPLKAIPYLRQFQPEGRVFTDYIWGGYLIWNVRQIPVFADSRVDIFEYNGAFRDYMAAINMIHTEEVFDRYHIRYVLFESKEPLSYFLQHSSHWSKRYDDGTAALFERVDGSRKPDGQPLPPSEQPDR